MQVLRFGLVALAAFLATLAPVSAQEQPKRIQGRLGDAPLLSAEAVEKLKLTAEQKDKYAKIEGDFKEKSKAAQDKFIEDVKGLRDREKYKELTEKFQSDKTKVRDDQLAKVEPILTAEQKTVFAQVKTQPAQPNIGVRPIQPAGGVGGVGQVLPAGVQQRLNLTDEQKKQIDAIQKEVEAKILKVLTDEQKKQYEEIKKGVIRRPGAQPLERNPAIRNPRPAPNPANPARNRD